MKLIFAQGNPALEYTKTRHNTGFMVIDAFAAQYDAAWKVSDKFHAQIAEITVAGEKTLLVKPLTYYNETGLAARKLIDFYKLQTSSDLIVIHDDLSLPLGTIRVRQKGSDAGNNGVKSLNQHIGEEYWRLRIGIWSEQRNLMDDADFVLSRFGKEEEHSLQNDLIPRAITLLNAFLAEELESHSQSS